MEVDAGWRLQTSCPTRNSEYFSLLPEVSTVEGSTFPCQVFTNQTLLKIWRGRSPQSRLASAKIHLIDSWSGSCHSLVSYWISCCHSFMFRYQAWKLQGCNPFVGVAMSKTYWDKTMTMLHSSTPTWACKPAAKPATWAAASWSIIVTQHDRRHTVWQTNW